MRDRIRVHRGLQAGRHLGRCWHGIGVVGEGADRTAGRFLQDQRVDLVGRRRRNAHHRGGQRRGGRRKSSRALRQLRRERGLVFAGNREHTRGAHGIDVDCGLVLAVGVDRRFKSRQHLAQGRSRIRGRVEVGIAGRRAGGRAEELDGAIAGKRKVLGGRCRREDDVVCSVVARDQAAGKGGIGRDPGIQFCNERGRRVSAARDGQVLRR